jgi:hypothetical protein
MLSAVPTVQLVWFMRRFTGPSGLPNALTDTDVLCFCVNWALDPSVRRSSRELRVCNRLARRLMRAVCSKSAEIYYCDFSGKYLPKRV